MVQREVADRFSAAPGTPAYGSLTIAVLVHPCACAARSRYARKHFTRNLR